MSNKRRLPIFAEASKSAKQAKYDESLESKKVEEDEQMDPLVQGKFKNEVNAILKQLSIYWTGQLLDNAKAISEYRDKTEIEESDVNSALEIFTSSFVDQEKELENKQKLRAKKLNAVPLPEIDRKNKFPLPRERSNQMLPDYTRLDAEEAAKRGISEQMRIDFHTKRQYKALDQNVPIINAMAPVSATTSQMPAPRLLPPALAASATDSKTPAAHSLPPTLATDSKMPVARLFPTPKRVLLLKRPNVAASFVPPKPRVSSKTVFPPKIVSSPKPRLTSNPALASNNVPSPKPRLTSKPRSSPKPALVSKIVPSPTPDMSPKSVPSPKSDMSPKPELASESVPSPKSDMSPKIILFPNIKSAPKPVSKPLVASKIVLSSKSATSKVSKF